MKVSDILQIGRGAVPIDKLDEYDWYSNLDVEVGEFGYMIHCTCGEINLGSILTELWIKEHYQHKGIEPNDDIANWLDNLCESNLEK